MKTLRVGPEPYHGLKRWNDEYGTFISEFGLNRSGLNSWAVRTERGIQTLLDFHCTSRSKLGDIPGSALSGGRLMRRTKPKALRTWLRKTGAMRYW